MSVLVTTHDEYKHELLHFRACICLSSDRAIIPTLPACENLTAWTEMQTKPKQNPTQIGTQNASPTPPEIRFSRDILRDQNELAWRDQNGLAWCDSFSFLIVKASSGGGGLSHYVSSFWSRFLAPRGGVRPCSWSLPKEAHLWVKRHHIWLPIGASIHL